MQSFHTLLLTALLLTLATQAGGADAPKPLTLEERLIVAEATILVQDAQARFTQARAQLEELSRKYQAVVQDLQQAKGAVGCQLNAKQDWVSCPDPKVQNDAKGNTQ